MLDNKFLICLDLDGTLLKDDKSICFFTQKYLKYLENKGNIVLISTGRPLRTSLPAYNKIKLNSPIMIFNGALICNPKDPSFETQVKYLKKEIVLDVYNKFKGSVIDNVLMESLNAIYYDIRDEFLFKFYKNNILKEINGDINKNLNEDVIICVMHIENKTQEQLKELEEYVSNKYEDVAVHFWGHSPYCDLHLKIVNKANAIRYIASKYNIKEDNIITFGDSLNDNEMVSEFENGYAMKNALKQTKDIAKHITKKDNNHNGIAFELIKIFRKIKH